MALIDNEMNEKKANILLEKLILQFICRWTHFFPFVDVVFFLSREKNWLIIPHTLMLFCICFSSSKSLHHYSPGNSWLIELRRWKQCTIWKKTHRECRQTFQLRLEYAAVSIFVRCSFEYMGNEPCKFHSHQDQRKKRTEMRVNGKLDIGTNHKSNVLSALGTCASETYKEFSWKKRGSMFLCE